MNPNFVQSAMIELPSQDVSEEPEEEKITAYIFVEQPIPTALARSGTNVRAHKLTEKFMACGLIMFTPKTSYHRFLVKLSHQLPCAIDDIVQEKITWKFQTPLSSRYLALGGEISFESMVKQTANKRSRIILLAMPPPTKHKVKKPVR